jgi:hypothetical protein
LQEPELADVAHRPASRPALVAIFGRIVQAAHAALRPRPSRTSAIRSAAASSIGRSSPSTSSGGSTISRRVMTGVTTSASVIGRGAPCRVPGGGARRRSRRTWTNVVMPIATLNTTQIP